MAKPDQRPRRKYPALIFGSAMAVAFAAMRGGGKRPGGSSVVDADKLANNIPTVCGGITRHVTNTPIVVGEVWSAEKCALEEREALIQIQTRLEQCFKRPPPQSVFDAATSHAWNLGVGATCGSSAMRAWNEGEWSLGCRRLAFADSGRRVWSFVRTGPNPGDMRFVQGLANRRDAEHRLCMTGRAT